MASEARKARRREKHEAYKAEHKAAASIRMPEEPPPSSSPSPITQPLGGDLPTQESLPEDNHSFYRPKVLEYAVIRIGVPLGFVGVGATLMTANHFLWGIVLLYMGLGMLAFDVSYEAFFRKLPKLAKVSAGVVYVVLIVIGSRLWVFLPAPLEMFSSSGATVYGSGSKLHGIEWLPRYSELTVDINNPTPLDYDNFDAQLTTDLVINHLVQATGLGECRIGAVHDDEPPHWQHMQNNQPVGPMDDPHWGYEVVPYDKHGNPAAPFLGADWTYRIRCDKIPAKSHVRLFGALVVVNEHVYDKPGCFAPCPWPFFDPPKPAKWVTLVARFQTSGRNRTRDIARCVVGSTCRNE
jgi:hypothetical protein